MNRIPEVGDQLVCSQFSGMGNIQGVGILKSLANEGLRTWTPLEDLQEASSGSTTTAPAPGQRCHTRDGAERAR